MLQKSSFVKWVPFLIFQKYISVHFLQTHYSLDSIILKCSEMSIEQILMKPLWSSLIWPEVSQKSPTHIFRALLFPALLCCLLWLLSTIVDEVDGMLGVGLEIFEDLEDFVKNRQAALWPCLWNPFYACYIALFPCVGDMILWWPHGVVCHCYFLVDTCIVHDPTFLWGLCRWE